MSIPNNIQHRSEINYTDRLVTQSKSAYIHQLETEGWAIRRSNTSGKIIHMIPPFNKLYADVNTNLKIIKSFKEALDNGETPEYQYEEVYHVYDLSSLSGKSFCQIVTDMTIPHKRIPKLPHKGSILSQLSASFTLIEIMNAMTFLHKLSKNRLYMDNLPKRLWGDEQRIEKSIDTLVIQAKSELINQVRAEAKTRVNTQLKIIEIFKEALVNGESPELSDFTSTEIDNAKRFLYNKNPKCMDFLQKKFWGDEPAAKTQEELKQTAAPEQSAAGEPEEEIFDSANDEDPVEPAQRSELKNRETNPSKTTPVREKGDETPDQDPRGLVEIFSEFIQNITPDYQNRRQKGGFWDNVFTSSLDLLKKTLERQQAAVGASKVKITGLVNRLVATEEEEADLECQIQDNTVGGVQILDSILKERRSPNLQAQLQQKRLEINQLKEQIFEANYDFLKTESILFGEAQGYLQNIREEMTDYFKDDIADIQNSYQELVAYAVDDNEQQQFQKQYIQIFEPAQQQLADFEKQCDVLAEELAGLVSHYTDATNTIKKRLAPLANGYSLSSIQQWVTKKMHHLELMRNVQNGQISLEEMSRVTGAIIQFALEHPNQKIFKMMNNASILFNQLSGGENLNLFWQTLLTMPAIFAINGVTSMTDLDADLDPTKLSEKEKEEWKTIQQFCELMEELPHTIAIMRGFDQGSSYGQGRIGTLLKDVGIPYLPCLLNLGTGLLGAQDRSRLISTLQSLPYQPTSTIDHFVRFYFTMNKKYANLQALRNESDQLRIFRAALINLPNGRLPEFNLLRKIQYFGLQLKHASCRQEVALRISAKAIAPACVAGDVACKVYPPLIALKTIVPAVGAVEAVFPLIAPIADLAKPLITGQEEWIDELYPETNEKVEASIRKEIFDEAWNNQKHQHELETAIVEAIENFQRRLNEGSYDEIILDRANEQEEKIPLARNAKDTYMGNKRKEFLAEESTLIRVRMTSLAKIYIREVLNKGGVARGRILQIDQKDFAAALEREVDLFMNVLTPAQKEQLLLSTADLKDNFEAMQTKEKNLPVLSTFRDYFNNESQKQHPNLHKNYTAIFDGIHTFKGRPSVS